LTRWQDMVVAATRAARDAVPPERAAAAAAAAAGLGLSDEARAQYAADTGAVLPVDREPPAQPLTDRQVRIAELIADGRVNREIAEALYVSVRTVEAEVRRAREALGLPSRTAVGAWAARQRDNRSTR
jgi:DNA-binding NarL/FixJ family response regulator